MKINPRATFVFIGLILGFSALTLKYAIAPTYFTPKAISLISYGLLILFTIELFYLFWVSLKKLLYFRVNLFGILLWLFIVILLLYSRSSFLITLPRAQFLATNLIFLRYLYHLSQILRRVRKFNLYLKHVLERPAQTIALSFLVVIIIGALFLLMPFATVDGTSLGFVNALFTATSAVCVTGLIVVDTATRFSIYGKLIILILIQIGGLGIMIISYFAAFIMGKRVSIEEKIALSYLLNEREMERLSVTILRIIVVTFSFELIGGMLLYRYFWDIFQNEPKAILFAAFHAISAFCNAGFALFSNSLEDFRHSLYVNAVISFLIISGGLSFLALTNIIEKFNSWFRNTFLKVKTYPRRLSLNTKAVLIMTTLLLIAGMLLIYSLEHRNLLVHYALPCQYLAAFFQSVTLRTAGFNTIDIGQLRVPTLLIMCVFMFIGAASGSTAGGVKVNTVFVIFAYIKALLSGKSEVVIMRHTLPRELVSRSFLIIILALLVVFTGTFILTLSEPYPVHRLLFEVASAFGTVGLSTGITPFLNSFSKLLIIITMFIGRIGPVTLILAISRHKVQDRVKYPEGEISIG